ncbi:response regulator transcription factor [Devosia sp. RR2S18]|uniref:response regulator transcription factor n=1 Tax=Devosia rhizosphaerae TaxID=3049774 RepID=UPI002540C26F|nr:LuxR C-terminal-related transcriptional regulator [Devosia sp. RR2S18]WIJ24742.1 LuxR C-terminal-related transcriptional regulator [Devosia sp. RR2S18]
MEEQIYYHPVLNRDRLVHIVDTDPSACEALSVLFRLEGFQTTFSVDATQFVSALERRMPDSVVLNLKLGGDSGLVLLRRIKAMRTATPVFMIADGPQVNEAVAAMKLGATDVISKPIDTEHLLGVVREALQRDVHLGTISSGRRSVEVRGFAKLTARERDVLQLISNGLSNKEAGRQLGISPRTVEVHRARIMEKLGAKNTADLMRIVLTG